MNKNFKQQIIDWWNDNKRVIKTGITFGVLGVAYGFIKGTAVTDKMWLEHGFEKAYDNSETHSDEFGLTEDNCDDPEMLDIVNFENENA